MKWWQYLMKVTEAMKEHPNWREGQAYFNVLRDHLPEMANRIRGTEFDPFYREGDDLDVFREWVSLQLP
jgi:hypothetical protein